MYKVLVAEKLHQNLILIVICTKIMLWKKVSGGATAERENRELSLEKIEHFNWGPKDEHKPGRQGGKNPKLSLSGRFNTFPSVLAFWACYKKSPAWTQFITLGSLTKWDSLY